jgi:hypothetical protein
MRAIGLRGRTGHMTWQPPHLPFTIECHSGATLGSTRAELHGWKVNVENGEAASGNINRYCQLSPRALSVRIEPFIEEVAHAILHHEEQAAVKRCMLPTRVWAPPGRIEGLKSGVEQTAARKGGGL